jgi:hypothetical protein
MNTKHIFVGIFAICGFFAQGQQAQAYFTTNQSAFKINETHALFVIEYAFGLEKNDIFMPGISKQGLAWGSTEKNVGYTIKADGETTTVGKVTSAVISKAPAVDGMYKLEKGKAQKMWLVVLYETNKDTKETDYALQVDHLPFYVDIEKNELATRQLNPSELQYYVTKEVELNTGNYKK